MAFLSSAWLQTPISCALVEPIPGRKLGPERLLRRRGVRPGVPGLLAGAGGVGGLRFPGCEPGRRCGVWPALGPRWRAGDRSAVGLGVLAHHTWAPD